MNKPLLELSKQTLERNSYMTMNENVFQKQNFNSGNFENKKLSQPSKKQLYNTINQHQYLIKHQTFSMDNKVYQDLEKQQTSNIRQGDFNQLQGLKQQFEQYKKQIKSQFCSLKTQSLQKDIDLELKLQKKAERSEFEKVLNLARLLAIQSEQIKMRFSENEELSRKTMKDVEVILCRIKEKQYRHYQKIQISQLKEKLNEDKELKLEEMFFKKLNTQNSSKEDKGKPIEEQQLGQLTKKQQLRQLTKKQQLKQQIQKQLLKIIKADLEMASNELIKQSSKETKMMIMDLKQDIRLTKQQLQRNQLQNINLSQTIHQNILKQCKRIIKLEIQNISEKQQKEFQIKDKNYNIRNHEMEELFVKKDMFEKWKYQQKYVKLLQYPLIKEEIENKIYQLTSFNTTLSAQLAKNRSNFQKMQEHFHTQYDSYQAMKRQLQQIQRIVIQEHQQMLIDFTKNQKEQESINEVLCSENVVARWLWTKAEIKGGNLIVWDKQIINTLPENYKISQNQYCIEVKNSGIYKMEMGFYSKKKPTIQIVVNGQTIVSAVNSNSYVLHHSSGRLKEVGGHSEVVGLTLIDYLSLPSNSKIAIAYIGQFPAEGFCGIQRL